MLSKRLEKGRYMKKRLLIILMLISVCLSGCRLQSAEEYRADTVSGPLAVTLEIRCDTLLTQTGLREEVASLLPADGVLLAQAEYHLPDGATAYTLLEQAAKLEGLVISTTGSGSSIYITSIGGIAEQDAGSLSGWIYDVNGEIPSLGCGSYSLAPGDAVRFLYTCDLGEDLSEPEA